MNELNWYKLYCFVHHSESVWHELIWNKYFVMNLPSQINGFNGIIIVYMHNDLQRSCCAVDGILWFENRFLMNFRPHSELEMNWTAETIENAEKIPYANGEFYWMFPFNKHGSLDDFVFGMETLDQDGRAKNICRVCSWHVSSLCQVFFPKLFRAKTN